jgi:hypothetical protein
MRPPAFRVPRWPPGCPASQVPNWRPPRPASRLPNWPGRHPAPGMPGWPPGYLASRVPRRLRPRYPAPSGLAAWPGSGLAARWFLAALCGPCPERAPAASRSLPSPTPLSAKSLTICSVVITPTHAFVSESRPSVRIPNNTSACRSMWARSRVSCWPVLGDNRIKRAFDAVRAVANARLTRLRAGAPASLGGQQRALRRRRGLDGGPYPSPYPERVPEPVPRARRNPWAEVPMPPEPFAARVCRRGVAG